MIALEVSCQSTPEETKSTFRYAFEQDEVLVGRDEAVDVRLPHPAVSLVHLRLCRKKGGLFALDSGSTNGTFVNGRRLEAGKAAALAEQSRIQIGPFVLQLVAALAVPALTGAEDTAAFARQMVLELLGAVEGGGCCYLEVETGPQRGERLEIPSLSPPLLIGRGEECQLRLRDADVSRQHLEVQALGDQVLARDLGSKNGFTVNGSRVSGEQQPLQDGDKVCLGSTSLVFCSHAQRYLQCLKQPDPSPPSAPSAEEPCRPVPAEAGLKTAAASAGQPSMSGSAIAAERQGASTRSAQSSWITATLGAVAVGLVLAALVAIVYVLL